MNVFLILMLVLAVKLPLAIVGWVLYRAINDAPAPEIQRDEGDFVRAAFDPGPRTRGPHGGPAVAVARRGDKGHDDGAVRQPRTVDDMSTDDRVGTRS